MNKENVISTQEHKKEIKKNILTGFFAVVAIVAVVCVIVFYFKMNRTGTQASVIKAEVKSLDQIVLSKTDSIVPYVSTDIDSIVYTVNSASEVSFFQFDGKQYTPLAETGSMNISVPLSNQQIPVTIHYVERDGKLSGFGVFTSGDNSNVYIYDYLLCKITNLPSAYAKDGKCLLLVNTDRKNVYSENPVWEEAYYLDRNNGSATRFLSENNRMLGVNGAVRSDFCMITNSEIRTPASAIPFYSSREYDNSENAPVDVYIKDGNKETLAVKNVLDKYTKVLDDGGFVCIKATNSGFSTVKYLNGQESTVTMYYSEYGFEYIRSGDWLLCKEDGRIYSTYSDTIIELPDFKINPTEFCVSSDGKYIVLAGTVANATDYQIYIYNTESKKSKTFADTDYSSHKGLRFASDSAATYYTTNANGYQSIILDISKVL